MKERRRICKTNEKGNSKVKNNIPKLEGKEAKTRRNDTGIREKRK